MFGMELDEKEYWANMLNCQLGDLPIKYLGMPVSDHKLGLAAFEPLVMKLSKRLDPWKGKYNSSGARLILSNTCLSSLPIYMMGFYFFHDRTHGKMDSIRSSFYWQGADGLNKYHMMKWDGVTIPKDYGDWVI